MVPHWDCHSPPHSLSVIKQTFLAMVALNPTAIAHTIIYKETFFYVTPAPFHSQKAIIQKVFFPGSIGYNLTFAMSHFVKVVTLLNLKSRIQPPMIQES